MHCLEGRARFPVMLDYIFDLSLARGALLAIESARARPCCFQAQVKTLHWLEHTVKLPSASLEKLETSLHALRVSQPHPTVAVGESNLKALKDVLFMTDAQVRSMPRRFGCCKVAPPHPCHEACSLLL